MPDVSLVLLPGLDGTGLLLQSLMAAIPPQIRPLVFAYPDDRVLSYQQSVDFVAERLPRDGPFVLLGESFSGPVATFIAARRPPNLIGLVLVATFATPPWRFVRPLIHLGARPALFRLYFLVKWARSRFFGRLTAERREQLRQLRAHVRPTLVAGRLREVFRVDAREALRQVNAPVLYIQATRDRTVPARNIRIIREILPSIQVARVDAPHMVLQAQPSVCARHIVDFVQSCASEPRDCPGSDEKNPGKPGANYTCPRPFLG